MLLAIDIGNTTISIAILEENLRKPAQPKIISIHQVETSFSPTALRKKLKQKLSALIHRYKVQDVIICSVVPSALALLKNILRKDLNINPRIVGEDIFAPIQNRYRNPRQVGQDRLVGSFAARELYGAPLIVIDFGTAITFDVVSNKGEYSGGIIVPGIRLTAEALFNKTALLPKVKIKTPRELIGRDTTSSILSGIFYGYGALCDGLIEQISQKTKGRPKVVFTGGYSLWMKKFISRKAHCLDRDLVFKGMSLISRREKKSLTIF
ncbi:MAG TPA: type III pantothenate kinase [Candidatus Omnitrophota bacterium]|nr:type III pantothenate kinase [Candidatus Omnitrophota bacterium]